MNRAQLFFSHQIESADGPARYESDSKVQCRSISRAASTALALAVVLLLSVTATTWAHAQTDEAPHRFQVLHRFHGKDGAGPLASLFRDAAGNLYGTTQDGGDNNCQLPLKAVGCGVVFKLSPTGKETVLHTFTGGADGAGPDAGLFPDAAGNLYGTAFSGGDLNCFPPSAAERCSS